MFADNTFPVETLIPPTPKDVVTFISPSSFTPPRPSVFLSSEIRFVNSPTVILYGSTLVSLRWYNNALITPSCPAFTPKRPATSCRLKGGLKSLPNAMSIALANTAELIFNSGLGNPLTHQWEVGHLWPVVDQLCPTHNPMIRTRRIQLPKTQDSKKIPSDSHHYS
ncbi:hypothetical protein G4B88_003854 [Cannabis sativa]|uniref:Uncharacterized protein n=1 Tax=Cannabis sativa TaxID=3483 RepID=A0A7J6FKZ2_CANSA|nr:hypothetical protein G4B88_003854 [Cannabis sativa]